VFFEFDSMLSERKSMPSFTHSSWRSSAPELVQFLFTYALPKNPVLRLDSSTLRTAANRLELDWPYGLSREWSKATRHDMKSEP
jgi:hypothetical protein